MKCVVNQDCIDNHRKRQTLVMGLTTGGVRVRALAWGVDVSDASSFGRSPVPSVRERCLTGLSLNMGAPIVPSMVGAGALFSCSNTMPIRRLLGSVVFSGNRGSVSERPRTLVILSRASSALIVRRRAEFAWSGLNS